MVSNRRRRLSGVVATLMNDLLPVTLADMIEEVRRELKLRRSVYPRLVEQRRLADSQAQYRLRVLGAVAELLEDIDSRGGWPTGQNEGDRRCPGKSRRS